MNTRAVFICLGEVLRWEESSATLFRGSYDMGGEFNNLVARGETFAKLILAAIKKRNVR